MMTVVPHQLRSHSSSTLNTFKEKVKSGPDLSYFINQSQSTTTSSPSSSSSHSDAQPELTDTPVWVPYIDAAQVLTNTTTTNHTFTRSLHICTNTTYIDCWRRPQSIYWNIWMSNECEWLRNYFKYYEEIRVGVHTRTKWCMSACLCVCGFICVAVVVILINVNTVRLMQYYWIHAQLERKQNKR